MIKSVIIGVITSTLLFSCSDSNSVCDAERLKLEDKYNALLEIALEQNDSEQIKAITREKLSRINELNCN